MYVVEIGNIASVHGNDPQLPETGIIIKATAEVRTGEGGADGDA